MATNSGKGFRQGSVKERSQILNPATGHYIKRDLLTGKFLDIKKDGSPFKGIRKEVSKILSNPNLNKIVASKAEQAVINVKNRSIV